MKRVADRSLTSFKLLNKYFCSGFLRLLRQKSAEKINPITFHYRKQLDEFLIQLFKYFFVKN